MNVFRIAMKSLPGHWHQGSIGSGANRCVFGHMCDAIQDDEAYTFEVNSTKLLNTVAREMFPDRVPHPEGSPMPAAQFNDHPDTTEDDCLAVLDKCATIFDEKAGL